MTFDTLTEFTVASLLLVSLCLALDMVYQLPITRRSADSPELQAAKVFAGPVASINTESNSFRMYDWALRVDTFAAVGPMNALLGP